MNFAGFNQAENFSFAQSGHKGADLRRSHFDQRLTTRAKRSQHFFALPQDDCFFFFKSDFGFSFHLEKLTFDWSAGRPRLQCRCKAANARLNLRVSSDERLFRAFTLNASGDAPRSGQMHNRRLITARKR